MADESNILSLKLSTLHEDVVEMKDALRSLSAAITKLALIEERQAQAGNALQRAFEAIERVERRLIFRFAAAMRMTWLNLRSSTGLPASVFSKRATADSFTWTTP